MFEAIDTNVVLYAYVDFREPRKSSIARELMERLRGNENGLISTQVLKEFANIALKGASSSQGFSVESALLELTRYHQVVVDDLIVLRAVRRHFASRISFYDALIIEAALSAGAAILYSEDMQHGQVFDGLRIVNPFL